MVKETDQSQNSRLSVSLERHFDKVVADLEKRIDQRFDLMQLAVSKAEAAANERADKANEWRAQYNDQEKIFLRKDEFNIEHKLVLNEIKSVDNKIAGVSKIVYIGLGIWVVVQILIGAGLT
jgi:hypothetical protein